MLAAGALKAFEVLENHPNLVQEISRKSELLHDNFDQLKVKWIQRLAYFLGTKNLCNNFTKNKELFWTWAKK